MNLEQLLTQLNSDAESVQFTDVIEVIESHYQYVPVSFKNGSVENAAGTNQGSCKIFAFAQLQGLSEAQTLQCFGDYYRVDVLQHPDADDHGNIRQFMQTGWSGIVFDQPPLTEK